MLIKDVKKNMIGKRFNGYVNIQLKNKRGFTAYAERNENEDYSHYVKRILRKFARSKVVSLCYQDDGNKKIINILIRYNKRKEKGE